MKIKAANFDDWFRLYLRAPQKVKDILLKAYPEYKNKIDKKYKEVFEPIKEKAPLRSTSTRRETCLSLWAQTRTAPELMS